MAFTDYEDSRHGGRPIKLFKFMLGPLPEDELRYTDAETVQALENKPYTPVAISHSKLSATGTLDRTTMTVKMQNNTELAEVFRVYPPSYVITLQMYQGHAGDPANQFLAAWGGKVINAAWPDNELSLTCEPSSIAMRRPGLTRNYQRSCPHNLYGESCGAPKIPLDTICLNVYREQTITVSTVGGDPQAYSNGSIEWVNAAGRREIVSIRAAAGDGALKLAGLPSTLQPGMPVKLYKGCDHTMGARGCDMHGNILNYGGQPWIPERNPINSLSEYI